METRASPFVVGLFTLGTLVLALTFIYWYSRTGETGPTQDYRVVFADEVTGLSIGAPVLYSGIRIGTVYGLGLSPIDPTKVVAEVRVEANAPVREDTRARIQSQGLTGLPFIQLVSGEPNSPPLVETWQGEGIPIIVAEPSGVGSLIDRAQVVMSKIESAVTRVDNILAGNEQGINKAISNIEIFSAALAERADTIGSFMDDAAAAARRLNALGEKLETLANTLQERFEVIDPETVRETAENLRTFTAGLAENTDELQTFLSDASKVATRLTEIADKIDPDSIEKTVQNMEAFTTTLGERTEQIEKFFDDATAVAAQFRETAKRIDGIVSGFSDSEGGSLITEVTAAARAFRRLSEQLSGKGLRSIDALVSDGRQTLNNINRVLSNLERNPTGFLSGQSQVRESSGNRR